MREKWSSRPAFIVAAVGSAIGFGNVWRFPSLAYKYGGGAFFIPYILALVIIGIPILILEISVGQYYQTGDAGSFGRINKRFRGVGLASVSSSFFITTYYSVLLAWVLRMFVYSFQGSDGRWGNSGTQAFDWFINVVTGTETVIDGAPTRIIGPTVGALAIVWISVFFSLAFGIKWTGRIAFITVGLPVVFLFILLIRAVILPGAGVGIKAYIGEWDLSVLATRPAAWSEAVTQIFFSLGVTFGTMTAFASYNDRKSPVFSNSLIIALSNSLYSIVAGFAVFSTIGYIATLENKPIEELKISGPALIFATYPFALSTLPGASHWERLLFVVLYLLGIDSAFSLTEAVVTVLHDTRLLRKVSRYFVTGGVCIVSFLFGLIYCTDTGLNFLDAADFYINFVMLLVGFFECFSVGWMYGIDAQMEAIGTWPVLAYIFATFCPIIIASGLWFGTQTRAILNGFLGLIVSHVVLMGVVFILCIRAKNTSNELTWRTLLVQLFMGNMLHLRSELIGVVRYIPLLWFFMIRHIVPQLLLILFANLASSRNEEMAANFGNYASLPVRFQVLGIFLFSVAIGIIVIGFVFPSFYACFDITTIPDEDIDLSEEVGSGKQEVANTKSENVEVVQASV